MARDDHRFDAGGTVGRFFGHFCMNADPMPYGELNVMPIEQRHQPLFEVVVRAERGAFAEDSFAIHAAGHELGLEDVVLVLGS